jgi:hypothetical protein
MSDSYLNTWRDFVREQNRREQLKSEQTQNSDVDWTNYYTYVPTLTHNAKITFIAAIINAMEQARLRDKDLWPREWERYGADIASIGTIMVILEKLKWSKPEIIEAAKEAGYVVTKLNIIKQRKS